MTIETLRPDAAGEECSITDQSGCAACPNHWGCVDEASPDDDTTRVQTPSTSYQRDLYNLPASSGAGTINFIKIYFRCSYGVDQGYAKPSLRSNSTVTDGTEVAVTAWPTWTTYSQQWNTNPADGQPWQWADIDALQIGVSLKAASGRTVYCTQVYVEVDYTVITTHELVVTDGLQLTDALVKNPIKVLSDGVALSDVLIKNPIKVLTDGIAFTDAWEGYKLLIKVISDGITLTDTLLKSTSKVLSDGIAFTDTLVKQATKVLSDSIAFTDALIKTPIKVFTDRIAFTDVLRRDIIKVFTDAIAFTDILKKLWVHGVLRILTAVRNLLSIREEGTKR